VDLNVGVVHARDSLCWLGRVHDTTTELGPIAESRVGPPQAIETCACHVQNVGFAHLPQARERVVDDGMALVPADGGCLVLWGRCHDLRSPQMRCLHVLDLCRKPGGALGLQDAVTGAEGGGDTGAVFVWREADGCVGVVENYRHTQRRDNSQPDQQAGHPHPL
jgi:hypothetical protein